MKKRMKILRGFLLILLTLSMGLVAHGVSAEEYLLKATQATVFAGDEVNISDYLSDEEVESIQYTVSDNSENRDCIVLGSGGKVTTVSAGQAEIVITYIRKGETTEIRENFAVNVLNPEELTQAYGSVFTLRAMEIYGNDMESYTFEKDSVKWQQEKSSLQVCGFSKTEIYAKKKDLTIKVATVTVSQPQFMKKSMARAMGTEAFLPQIQEYTSIGDNETVWSVSESLIAQVSENGILAKKTGKTDIQAVITAENGETATLRAELTVTNPKVQQTTFALAKGKTKKITVSGVCDASTYEYSLDTTKKAYFKSKKTVYGSTKGTIEIAYIVDGKTFTIKVIVTNPEFQQRAFSMYKGLKKQLPVKGLSKTYSKVTYTSSNKKIVTVTKKGKLTAKKTGVAYVTVKADGKTFKVWIQISTKTGYKASKKEIAIAKTKTVYSQARRMQKGYYDCSSLVSRVYRKYGVYFGSKSGWSPTAAAIGNWCTGHGKVIYKKGVSYKKLVPGDLVFYSHGKNGRYLDITHIEMYVGNGMSVSASGSYNKVVHYNYNKNCVVLIARPTK